MIWPANERFRTLIEWLLLAAFTGLLVFHTLPKTWNTLDTDFPNYYLVASLAREGVDTSRMYEWRWLQREKDRRAIDQAVIGLAPITPFSTLVLWPLTKLAPLEAKRAWTLLQFPLMLAIVGGLSALTGQRVRRVTLLAVACIPLHRNLMYGQFYIVILGLLVAGCWADIKRFSSLAGSLIGIAAMLKIFPAVFLLYFLRKRDWRALFAAGLTLCVCTALSIFIFGWQLHRVYLQSVLPWTLRGEAMPPYALASESISTLLHRLFVYEPQWNTHPWISQPILCAALAPILQMLVLAPAVLLIQPFSGSRESTSLEWAALLTATLSISTVPASYNFTLLLFSIVVLCSGLRSKRPAPPLVALALYLGIGYPAWKIPATDGWHALAHVPRLYLLLLFTVLCCWTLATSYSVQWSSQHTRWAAALAAIATIGSVIAIHQQKDMYDDYQYRLPMRNDILLAADPIRTGDTIEAIELTPRGYRLASDSYSTINASPSNTAYDILSFAKDSTGIWREEDLADPRIVSPRGSSIPSIKDAHSPTLSHNGQGVAYIRDEHGIGRLMQQNQRGDLTLTPQWMNVEETFYLDSRTLAVAATTKDGPSEIYLIDPALRPLNLHLGEARYPTASPDGRWLAYSRYERGVWNLWLLDRADSSQHRLTQAPCNQIQPSWESDSATLLYASDCGRALGLTALCRRKVVPVSDR